MKRLLLLENDHPLAANLTSLLQQHGYEVDVTGRLSEGYAHLDKHHYDGVVVDRLLDDGDGRELVDYLKGTCSFLPILCLSQLNQTEDRILLLKDGADDYLGKPFSATELLLRLEKLLHKQKLMNDQVLELGPLQFHPQTGQLISPQYTKHMRKREAEILTCLFRYQNQVVSRETLIEYIWQGMDAVPTYTTLDVYIRRLRVILGEYHTLIRTVRGFGYTLTT